MFCLSWHLFRCAPADCDRYAVVAMAILQVLTIRNGRSSLHYAMLCYATLRYVCTTPFISLQFLIDIVYVFFSLHFNYTRKICSIYGSIGDIDTLKLIITTALKMVRWHRFHCADTSTSIQRERKWEKEWASESNENWCWSWNLYSVCARAIAERNKANKIIADWARNIYPKCLSWCRISFVYSRPCCYNDTRRLYHPIVPRICTVEIPNRFGCVITQSPKKIIIAIRSWRFLCLYIWLCMAKKMYAACYCYYLNWWYLIGFVASKQRSRPNVIFFCSSLSLFPGLDIFISPSSYWCKISGRDERKKIVCMKIDWNVSECYNLQIFGV